MNGRTIAIWMSVLICVLGRAVDAGEALEYKDLLSIATGEHAADVDFNLEQIEDLYGRAVVKITFTPISNLGEIRRDPRQQEDCDTYSRGQGSGFFINEEGYILTNAHVVDSANRRTLRCRSHLTGSTEFDLQLIGLGDEDAVDLAVLKLDPRDCKRFLKLAGLDAIPYLTIRNSETLAKTEQIAIMGYPEDSDDLRVKQAQLSGWEFADGEDSYLFLEVATASAVMSGNSGGAAVNRFGEMIGIPSRADWDESRGYLIPTYVITHFIDQIANNQQGRKKLEVLDLGIGKERTFPGMAVLAGLPEDFIDFEIGMAVFRVRPGSLSERWGLQPGDVVVSCRNRDLDRYVYLDFEGRVKTTGKMAVVARDGREWDNTDQRKANLSELVMLSRPGDTVELEYARPGMAGMQVAAGQLEFCDRKPVPYLGPFEVPEYTEWGGMILQDINSANISYSEYAVNRELFTEGTVVITQVDGGSLADERQIDTFITALNGHRVRNLIEFRQVLKDMHAAYDAWVASDAYDQASARYNARFYVNVEYLMEDTFSDTMVTRQMAFPIDKARQTGRSLDDTDQAGDVE